MSWEFGPILLAASVLTTGPIVATITGQTVTASQGSLTTGESVTETLSGQIITVAQGVQALLFKNITGQTVTFSQGLTAGELVTETLSSQNITSSQGSVSEIISPRLTSQSLTFSTANTVESIVQGLNNLFIGANQGILRSSVGETPSSNLIGTWIGQVSIDIKPSISKINLTSSIGPLKQSLTYSVGGHQLLTTIVDLPDKYRLLSSLQTNTSFGSVSSVVGLTYSIDVMSISFDPLTTTRVVYYQNDTLVTVSGVRNTGTGEFIDDAEFVILAINKYGTNEPVDVDPPASAPLFPLVLNRDVNVRGRYSGVLPNSLNLVPNTKYVCIVQGTTVDRIKGHWEFSFTCRYRQD